jgi:hypothetical protein
MGRSFLFIPTYIQTPKLLKWFLLNLALGMGNKIYLMFLILILIAPVGL